MQSAVELKQWQIAAPNAKVFAAIVFLGGNTFVLACALLLRQLSLVGCRCKSRSSRCFFSPDRTTGLSCAIF